MSHAPVVSLTHVPCSFVAVLMCSASWRRAISQTVNNGHVRFAFSLLPSWRTASPAIPRKVVRQILCSFTLVLLCL